jgi:moderate conductance mechanosensitive channel
MVVVPVVATQISYPAAAAANLVIMLALTLYALALILRNRKPIQLQINLLAERSMAFFSIILRGWAMSGTCWRSRISWCCLSCRNLILATA